MGSVKLSTCGYVCSPHVKNTNTLIERWKNSDNVQDIYFVTATFANDNLAYFPNRANHYILCTYNNMTEILEDLSSYLIDKLSFFLDFKSGLFERNYGKLDYVSIYYTKYDCEDNEICEIANVLARRDRVKTANMANFELINKRDSRFVFPYSKNIIVLEIEGEKTHQSDQRYCEKTRMDVARKGISLTNFVSFSILDKLK